jgi:hypothetical protein
MILLEITDSGSYNVNEVGLKNRIQLPEVIAKPKKEICHNAKEILNGTNPNT